MRGNSKKNPGKGENLHGYRRIVTVLVLSSLAIALIASTGKSRSDLASEQRQEQEESDLVKLRSEWFYGQRAYPHQYVPSGANLRALAQLDYKRRAEALLWTAGALAPTWTFVGPKPVDTPYTDPVVAGRVTALAINPANSNIVYLGAAQGGVWKTTDGGLSWVSLMDSQPSLAVGSIALDPAQFQRDLCRNGRRKFLRRQLLRCRDSEVDRQWRHVDPTLRAVLRPGWAGWIFWRRSTNREPER